MQADPLSKPAAADCAAHDAAQRELADRWRAGCLDARQRLAFERAMAADPRLAEQAAYGRRLAHTLQALPQLANRAARHRARARRVHWQRVLAAGMLSAGLAGLSFGLLPILSRPRPQATAPLQQIQASPQLADAVQNLDFYEWLAAHPRALDSANPHGGTA